MKRVTNALNPRGDAAAAPSPPYYLNTFEGSALGHTSAFSVYRRGFPIIDNLDREEAQQRCDELNEAYRDGYAAGKAAK